jgi:hypothetical protein
MASTLEELHSFAQSIGLKRHWFHNKRRRHHPHYDLKGRYVQLAIKAGSNVMTTRWLIIFNHLHRAINEGKLKQVMEQYSKDHPPESQSAKWSREYKEMESLHNAMKNVYN